MYIAEFLSHVKNMRMHQDAFRMYHLPKDAAKADEYAKLVDRGLAEGVTVIEAVEEEKQELDMPQPIAAHFDK